MSSLESYAHKAAKSVLVGWMRSAVEKSIDTRFNVCGLYARPNRGEPHFGIHEEYPLTKDMLNGQSVWDEMEWWSEWEEKFGRPPEGSATHDAGEGLAYRWCSRPPTRDELIALNMRPTVILDAVVQHKGWIAYGFEIVHKNPVSPKKAAQFGLCGFQVFEIPAEWILAQVDVPDRLVVKRAFGRDNGFSANIDWWRRR